MIDATTRKPLHVSTDGTAGPYIRLPYSQVQEVRQLLDGHGVRYQVEQEVISLNGAPEVAIIDLGRAADARTVQVLLDSIR